MMASFNASVSDESKSKVALENRSQAGNHTGQCTHMRSLALGTLQLVAGNGTSVGTVMTLLCPVRHRAISGGRISCVQDNNSTQWSGGIPECKPLSRYEDQGLRLAVLVSIVSAAIILFMSIIFITSCLLKRVKKEEMRQLERERKREADGLWHHSDAEEQRESFYNHNGRNNNNNNNSRPEQHTLCSKTQSVPSIQPFTFSILQTACRCHQQDYNDPLSIHHSRSSLGQMPPKALCINSHTTCILQPHNTHSPPLLCDEYDSNLEQPPWNQAIPTVSGTQEGQVSAEIGRSHSGKGNTHLTHKSSQSGLFLYEDLLEYT